MPDKVLERAAAAVLDGTPIDWEALEASAQESDRVVVRQLRVLAEVGSVHRDAPAVAASDFTSWGPLRIIELISRGAFGQVYRAWDTRLDREVALKLLDPAPDTPEADLAGTIIEDGRLLARVRHPNVVTVYGADHVEGRVGLWMELLAGRTLADRVATDGPLAPGEVVRIGVGLCGALSAVHAAGLLHQDVKAQNVVIEPTGRVVLMDFGAGIERPPLDVREMREVAGTPLYLAPERFDGHPPTVQADVYSLGVLLFYLATGTYPIVASTVRELRDAHHGRRRTSAAQRGVPAALAVAIDQAVDPEPTNRFAHVQEMAAALERILTPPTPMAAAPGTSIARRGRSALLMLATASLVGLGVAMTNTRLPEVNSRAGWPLDQLWGAPTRTGVQGNAQESPSGSPVPQVNRQVPLPPVMVAGPPSWNGGMIPYLSTKGELAVWDPSRGNTTAVHLEPALGDDWPEALAISPDGDEVALGQCSTPDRPCTLSVASVTGGARRHLAVLPQTVSVLDLQWSADDDRLFGRLVRANGVTELSPVGLAGGAVQVLREFRTARPVRATLSPDGREVVFDLPSRFNARQRDIFLLSVADGHVRGLVQHPASDASPIWTPDGSGVFFLSDRSGIIDGWIQPVANAGQEPARVLEAFGRGWLLGASRDGTLYYWRQNGTVDIYVGAVERADGRSVEAHVLQSRYAGVNIAPGWSPDERFLAFISMRPGISPIEPGARVITIHDVETGRERDVDPDLSLFPHPVKWAPDGRRVLCLGADRAGRDGIYVVDTRRGTAQIAVDGLFTNLWSPDGRSVAFFRPAEGLVVRDLAQGTERIFASNTQLGVAMVRHLGFSPDGRQLAFSGAQRGQGGTRWRIGVIDFDEGLTNARLTVVDETGEATAFVGWTATGQELLLARGTLGDPKLWAMPVRGGHPRALHGSLPGVFVNPAQVSPDGRRVASTHGRWQFDVWMLQHAVAAAR